MVFALAHRAAPALAGRLPFVASACTCGGGRSHRPILSFLSRAGLLSACVGHRRSVAGDDDKVEESDSLSPMRTSEMGVTFVAAGRNRGICDGGATMCIHVSLREHIAKMGPPAEEKGSLGGQPIPHLKANKEVA